MGIKYRSDDDLDFLQYCREDDLRLLARYMTHDKDGQPRFASELFEHKDFKRQANKSNQYQRSWHLIVGELQHFGGDTFVNLFRGEGVTYKEILSDVCSKLKVKFDKKDAAYEIEGRLLEKLISDAWQKMDGTQETELLNALGLDNKLKGAAGLLALQTAVKLGGSSSYIVSAIVAEMFAEMFAGQTVAIFAAGGARLVSILSGPIGIAILTILTIPAISGAAYRVTIPAVCQIAYMRRAYAEQDRF